MFLLQNYWTAIAFCVVTMICWGSWANTQKLVDKKWRYELFYWDYVLGLLATAVVFAMTWGSKEGGVGPHYIDNLCNAIAENPKALVWAFAGGVVFNIANILLVSAIDIAGMAVAFPVGIGLALVLGVVWNYMGAPEASGNPVFLFVGVGLVALAIILSALSYKKRDAANADPNAPKKPIGKGLALSVLCGVLMSLFYFFVAKSLARVEYHGELIDLTLANLSQEYASLEPGKLTPYTANLIFAVGILLSNCVIMPILMRFPIVGEPVEKGLYWKGSFGNHFWGWIGGMIWAIGMTFNVLASGVASPAVAYGLGQGATLMSAIWGVFIWREFKGSPKGVGKMLAWMFLFFIVGLALIIVTKLDNGTPAQAAPTEAEQVVEEGTAEIPAFEDVMNGDVVPEGVDEQAAENAVEEAAEAVDQALENIEGAVEEAAQEATEAAEQVEQAVEKAAEEAVEEVVEPATEAVENAVEETTEAVQDAVEEVVEPAQEAVEQVVEEATEAAQDAAQAVEETVEQAVDAVEEAVAPAEPAPETNE